jgi:hypothetical protein
MAKKKATKEDSQSEIKVFDKNYLVRTYSLEVHGADYQILAEQFANKKNYQLKYD